MSDHHHEKILHIQSEIDKIKASKEKEQLEKNIGIFTNLNHAKIKL